MVARKITRERNICIIFQRKIKLYNIKSGIREAVIELEDNIGCASEQ